MNELAYKAGYLRGQASMEKSAYSWSNLGDHAQSALNWTSMAPGPIGWGSSLANAGIDLAHGRLGSAAWNGFLAIPGIGDAAKWLKGGTAIARGITGLGRVMPTVAKGFNAIHGAQQALQPFHNTAVLGGNAAMLGNSIFGKPNYSNMIPHVQQDYTAGRPFNYQDMIARTNQLFGNSGYNPMAINQPMWS